VEERRLPRPAERREREQPLGDVDVDLVRDDGEVGVEEPRRLLLHRLDDVRVRVPDVEAADAAGEVDDRVAVDVGQRRAVSLRRAWTCESTGSFASSTTTAIRTST